MSKTYYITEDWGYGRLGGYSGHECSIKCEFVLPTGLFGMKTKKLPLFVERDEKGDYYEYLTGTLLANTMQRNYKEPLRGIWVNQTSLEKSPVEFEKALNGLTERDKERMAEQFRTLCKKAEEFYNRHMEQERKSNQANDDAAVRLNRRRKY